MRAFAERYPGSPLRNGASNKADSIARDQQSIRTQLSAWVKAYNDHDSGRLKEVYPEYHGEFDVAWRNYGSNVEMENSGDPQITGDDTAYALASLTYSMKNGAASKRSSAAPQRKRIQFRKRSGAWKIIDISAAQ